MTTVTKTIWTKAELEAWALPQDLTVTQWSDSPGGRVLDPAKSAVGGQYSSAITPYMRGPMDAFTDPEVEEIDVMGGRQISKSTAIQNMIGYTIDQDPGPSAYVVPNEGDADERSKEIFKPMLTLSPKLRRHTTGRPRDLMGKYFTLDRMTLYFIWAGSPAELAQRSIRYLYIDEPDKYPAFNGKDSTTLGQVEHCTDTYWDAKIVRVCTPTTTDGAMWLSYSKSNMCRYYCPCPHCGNFRVWVFGQLRCPKTLRDPGEIIEKADVWYECGVCGHRIYEDEKNDLVAEGVHLPEGRYMDEDGNIKGHAKRSRRHSGFQISQLVSPFPKATWPRIMADWFSANTAVGIAAGALMDFHNLRLGEPFRETAKRVKAAEVRKLTGGFDKGTCPAGTKVLVAGADYHKSRTRGIVKIDYEIRGFGYGQKNYVIDSGIVHSFDELDKAVLLRTFALAGHKSQDTGHKAQEELAVMCMFIDSGYESDDVYDYCRRHPGICIPTKGLPGPRLKPVTASELESATERRLSYYKRKKYRGMSLMILDTHYFKNQVTSWVEPALDAEGKIIEEPLTLFYDQIPSYYFTEFTNEQKVKVTDRKGNIRWVWQPVVKGAPTHSLDIAVLSAAAAFYKGADKLRDPDEKRQSPAARQNEKATKAKTRRPRRPAWLDNLPQL